MYMTPIDLFTQGLGLQAPWRVTSSDFTLKDGLRLVLSCDDAASLSCPACGRACPRYDAVEREWQHLGFWQHATHLRARVPRVSCPEHGVRQVSVAWARPELGFTLLFEAFALQLIKEMPVVAAARLLGVTDQRLWRLIHHHVDVSRSQQSLTQVSKIGIDETSANAKTPYITVVVDMDAARVVFATPGKDGATVGAFATDFTEHGGDPANITDVSCDMSAAFISGVAKHLPTAQITFDKFHVTKLVTDAVDEVRRAEVATDGFAAILKGSRYALLRNLETQSEDQAALARIITLPQLHLKSGRAYRLKLAFQDAYRHTGDLGVTALREWCSWAQRSRLPDFQRVARTIRSHWDGVIRYFTSRLTNAVLEGINSLIQSAKARARGFRTIKNLIAMVYVIAGKLPFPTLPRAPIC
jgi:transposase